MTEKRVMEVRSVPSGATGSISDVEFTTPADLILPYTVLKYVAETDDQTRRLSTVSDDLLLLANVTNVGTKSDFGTEIQKDFDFFMYFGHGLDSCIFDENGYCTIYPDNNLKDKILVLTACDCGKGYAKAAVRTYGAIASLGYGAALACEFSGTGFKTGFAECFLNTQKTLLGLNEVTESEFVAAYESTKALYNSWGDHYAATDPLCASLFYADGANLLSYSMWDVMTTMNISVDPTPCEVYKDNAFIGMAPIIDYSVMSGGNVFQYKAIGCWKTWLIRSIPKTGGSYDLSPVAYKYKSARVYSTENVYLEHGKWISVFPEPSVIAPFEMAFFNHGETSPSAMVSNDRGWYGHWVSGNTLNPHLINGTQYILDIDETFIHPPSDGNIRVEWVNITVAFGDVEDTVPIKILISPELPEGRGDTAYSSSVFSPFSSQYNQMSASEKNTRNIVIGTKTYTPTEIMEEIDKGTEIGVMLMETMR